MTARMRTALLAVVASLGLVAVAYGAGNVVGGGSSDAADGAPAKAVRSAPPMSFGAADHAGPRRHNRCPHMNDGGGSGGSTGSSDYSTAAPSDAQAY